ncbi:MAG TPA: hypothetical protein VK939_18695 [Longimicrobiales bacterium]|nr:hypothetical protein [Longimicrobiales bacterium]
MGPAGIALSMALLLGAPAARTPTLDPAAGARSAWPATSGEDPWFGADKYRHFFLSFAGTAFAYGAARGVMDADAATVFALGAGAVAGLGKEVLDRRAGRLFSVRDLAWDGLGLLAAYVLVRNTR